MDDALHLAERFGFHVRDAGLLASAVARPAAVVAGAEAYPDVAMKAAVLLESVARNHSLLDGNKRTAVTLALVFLHVNGTRHTLAEDEFFDLVVDVARGAVGAYDLADALRPRLAPIDGA
ncbi:type II toxin-antitoxin system death-on-curing family toxin [Zafaria sp. Z1313]|uniref:type II toxin-antitoxin system death-on-curing family toxin n=1 Tax=unclassified Zafaria TaxID=2828765 RepID=UPI002E76CD96|nr:type II toxin-antitoxin system death-on-curing family toxin [Zafaria sp. J156]MEE1620905.1 type II toxin-antitoxin system death-on-curing family toxin [Zafaria sp. J156]